MKFEPHPYQVNMMLHMIKHAHCAVWAEMGLGKTVSTGSVIEGLLESEQVTKVLVVAPKRVVDHVWPAELQKWDHIQHLSFMSLSCPLAQRVQRLKNDAQINLINYELLLWLVERHTPATWPYDMVVWDESSRLKNRATKRFRAARTISRAVKRSVELSGTPSPNGLMDLWSQMFLLDQGQRLGRTLTSYRQKYFRENRYRHTWEILPGSAEAIHEQVRDICISLTSSDYLRLPPRLDNDVMVSLPPSALRVYREMVQELLVEVGGQVITAVNAAVLTNKCLQICNGSLYDEEGHWAEVHNAKIEALEEIVDEAEGPVLVAYGYRSDEERLLKAFPQAVALAKAKGAIEAWNAGNVPIGLAHPASMGHGLNLQDGGHTLVWFGMTWNLELYQQMNARLHRQGQNRPVIVHHILAEDTMDVHVKDVLTGKASVQDALMKAVKL